MQWQVQFYPGWCEWKDWLSVKQQTLPLQFWALIGAKRSGLLCLVNMCRMRMLQADIVLSVL